MKREEKYPETDTFVYFNANPRGRITSDCSFRAIARATGESYNDVVMRCAEVMCKTGYDTTRGKGLEIVMASYGFTKHKQPRKEDGRKYTVAEFCREIADHSKRYLVSVASHDTCIVNGKCNDTWNCTYKTVGNYWTV